LLLIKKLLTDKEAAKKRWQNEKGKAKKLLSLNLIPCHVFAVVLAHTHPHTISFLMAQWSPDPMTCDVQMLSCLPGCLYPSVRLSPLRMCVYNLLCFLTKGF